MKLCRKEKYMKYISLTLSAVLLFTAANMLTPVQSENTIPTPSIVISMPDSNPSFNFHSGLWHYVNITFQNNPGMVQFVLKMNASYRDDGTSNNSNKLTFYKWTFDGQEWLGSYLEDPSRPYDPINQSTLNNFVYIDINKCSVSGHTYSFYVGVDSQVHGTWLYAVYSDNTRVADGNISILQTNTGLALTGASPIKMYITPYTRETVNGDAGAKIINNGNIPVVPIITFEELPNYLSYNLTKPVLAPGEACNVYMKLNSGSWPPQTINLKYTVTGQGIHEIKSAGANSFIIRNLGLEGDIQIMVGHSEMIQKTFGNGLFVFHYPIDSNLPGLEVYHEMTYHVYLYGQKRTDVSFIVTTQAPENTQVTDAATVQSISYNNGSGKSLDNRLLSFTLDGKKEVKIDITVRANIGPPAINVFNVYYEIRAEGYSEKYYNAIEILEPATETTGVPGSSEGVYIFLGIVSLSFLYIAINYMRGRREI